MGARLEDLRRDAVYGLRLLAKHRSFTIVAGLTLALGIGATSAIFSILNASVLGPLPFRDPGRLVWIEQVDEQGRPRGIPVPAVENWRRESRTLEHVSHALMGQVQFTLQFPGGAERVRFEQVDFHTFPLFGVEPVLGRWFRPDEVIVQGNTAQTVVISYGMWQRLFGGDPDVIGKSLPGWSAGWGEIVIGVMPRGFYTHPSRLNTDAWYVIANNPGATIGRLAQGVSVEQAQTELNAMAPPAGPQGPGPGGGTFRVGVGPLHDVYTRGYARTLYLLLGAVGFVLLIATVNVANLQLNRGLGRQTEMATRIALGAGRWRVFRQLIVENVILVLVGGVLGILIAYAGIRLFVYVAPTFYPPSQEIGIDRNVLLFMLGVCLATGLLSGLAPGLRASNPDLHSSLKQGARGSAGSLRLRVRRTLVVAEIALAMVLLVGAGLMINSYAQVTSVEMGLDASNVLSMDVSLMGMDRYRTRYGTNHYATTPAGAPFFTQALAGIAALPGVESVGLASVLPPGGGGPSVPIRIVGGSTPEGSVVQYHEVSPDLFETMKIAVKRGRVFSESDHAAAPAVAVVNEAFVREFLNGADPIGQVIQASLTDQNPQLTPDRARQVVGVVADVRMFFRNDFQPIVYVPYQQHLADYSNFGTFGLHSIKRFVVRTTSSNPTAVATGVRRVFSEVDPGVAVENIQPMEAALATAAGGQAFWMRLLGIFAGLGVFLAAIGIYGVVSYSVEQRTKEFGIRATLGAQGADIQRLVLREGMMVTLTGLALGVAGAFAATRLLQAQLFGVSRMDPMTIVAVAAVLLAISLLACYIPGRRTTRLDPLLALRVE